LAGRQGYEESADERCKNGVVRGIDDLWKGVGGLNFEFEENEDAVSTYIGVEFRVQNSQSNGEGHRNNKRYRETYPPAPRFDEFAVADEEVDQDPDSEWSSPQQDNVDNHDSLDPHNHHRQPEY